MKKMLIKIFLFLTICLIAGAAYGDQTSCGVPPSPAVFLKLGVSGVTGDPQYLYVMAGGKISLYETAGMTFIRSVDLPKPTLPNDAPPQPKATDSGQFPPPPPPLPHGLWAGNNSLYVLAGPFIYVYSVPDLNLQNTVQLPKPDLPQVSK